MSQDAILAGVDTTGTTAAFLLLDLARNPDQQEELWREVRQCSGGHILVMISWCTQNTVLVYLFCEALVRR